MTTQHTQGRIKAVGVDLLIINPNGIHGLISGPSDETCRANAAELVRRWNAFEEGGAVRTLVEAAGLLLESSAVVLAEDEHPQYMTATRIALRAALSALVEPGAGAGREPQE